MTDLATQKALARQAAFARRKRAHAAGHPGQAAHLSALLTGYRGVPISSYMAIRTEIDPTPAMMAATSYGPVGVPVIISKGQPLQFRRWEPGCTMIDGGFGALIPETGGWMTPQVIIVPLVAFDRHGGRLGYGGGFYDRTLQLLRARGPVLAVGFAWSAQEDQNLPLETTDQPLDMIVTENGVITPESRTGT